MKYLFAGILILSILSFQFSELLVYAAFKINQDYIAKNLCIEKDIEGSTCKGCCHLKKKVNEQQEQKTQLPPLENNKQNIDFCSYSLNTDLVFYFNEYLLQTFKKQEYQYNGCYSIFHPPPKLT